MAAQYKIGDRVRIADDQFHTVLQAKKVKGSYPAAKGKVYLGVLVEIEGINPAGTSYNPFSYRVRDAEGFEFQAGPFGQEPALHSSNDLKPGKKVRGWVSFEVAPSSFTLLYSPGLSDALEVALGEVK